MYLASLLMQYVGFPGACLIGICVLFVVAVIVLTRIARRVDVRGRNSQADHDQEVQSLADLRLLDGTEYNARRVFQVTEFEDEGMHFFLELDDGRVIYLTGQYLYDLAGVGDAKVEAVFPCTLFTVRRHRDKGYFEDIRCAGSRLYAATVLPAFPDEYYQRDDVFQNGDVIEGLSFDELRREFEGSV